jgi:membrane-associated protease RseP (regulator of RpoE activity)
MTRKLSLALLFLIAATNVFADASDAPRRRTVIVRDGKVISSDGFLLRRVFLGFSPLDISGELREHLGAPKDNGVLVQSVKEGGPAAKAGLRVGDVVVSIDGSPVESAWTIGDLLDDKKAGDTVRLEIVRKGARQALVATVEERTDAPLKMLAPMDIPGFEHFKTGDFPPGMWKARVEASENCGDLQVKIKDLESRLKDLERKLQK